MLVFLLVKVNLLVLNVIKYKKFCNFLGWEICEI